VDARIDQTYRAIAAVTGVGRYFIKSASRQPSIVYARAVAILVMREALGMTWPAIAAELNREHSSVLELAQDHDRDQDIRADVAVVSETLTREISTGARPCPA
jgi:chromosomal replication initiation ATPase DnaA